MADGYGVGLFDSSGPEKFATSVKGIGTALGDVGSKFSDLASKASDALGRISSGIDDVVKKLQGLGAGVGAAAGGGGGGGGGGLLGPSGKPMSTGVADGSWKSPPPSQGGPASQGDPLAGMPQGTAQALGQFFQWMQEGSTTGVAAAQKTSQVGGGGNGMPQFSASRAAQALIPAAAGAVGNLVTGPGAGLVANAIQGTSFGQMFGQYGAFGVSSKSLFQAPQGTLQTSAGDYAQANIYALSQMGIAPGTQNWSTIQRGAQGLMAMVPGMSRQGAFAAMNQMQQPGTLQAGFRVGLNLRPGGQILDPQAQFGMIFNRLTMGQKVSPDTFWSALAPGGPGAANLQMLGITPGSDSYNAFIEYAQQRLKSDQAGTKMPDMSTAQGRKAAGLDTSAFSQLQAQSKLSRAEQGMEPGIADAAKNLNNAAAALLQAVTGMGLPGGLGGALGGVTNFLGPGGMMGAGLGMGALGIARRIPGVSGMLGKIPGIGSMLGQKYGFSKAAGRGLLKVGGKIPGLGRLGGLFGGGGEAAAAGGEAAAAAGGEAATTAGIVGGAEAAGLGLDATGVLAPIGLAVGALGLGYGMFHKPINSFIGGLFGHHKKSGGGTAGAAGDPNTDDMATLLAGKPPKGSVLDVLTQPGGAHGGMGMGVSAPAQHKGGKGLLGSIGQMAGGMIKGLPIIGGAFGGIQSLMSGGGMSGVLGAMLNSFNPISQLGQVVGGAQGIGSSLLGLASGTASAQTLSQPGSPYAWNARNLQSSPIDMSGLFSLYMPGKAPPSKQASQSGGSSANTTSTVISATGGTPHGTQAQNQALGKQMAAAMGWTGAEWTALNNVEMQEAGWDPTATNPTSGAYGIAQGITGPSWYAGYGGDSATVKGQITGFLNYVKQRYVTPSKAWAHEQQFNWYARGSQQIARTQLAVLHRGEAVVPAADNYNSGGTYNRGGAMGASAPTIHLNFRQGSIVLQVSGNPSQVEMDNVAKMFVTSVSKSQVLAGVRST
jgi:hypothetical protein